MLISPLDLQRLALRIERLQQTRTHDWTPGDDLEFKNLLPGGRDRRALPDPKTLREMASKGESPLMGTWQLWITMASRMESLIHRNDPRNPQKIIRDIQRGKLPWMR